MADERGLARGVAVLAAAPIYLLRVACGLEACGDTVEWNAACDVLGPRDPLRGDVHVVRVAPKYCYIW